MPATSQSLPEPQLPVLQDVLDPRQALQHAMAALDEAERHGVPHQMGAAYQRLAQCFRALDAHAAAEDALRSALGWAHCTGSADAVVDVLCALADAACAAAEVQGAADPHAGFRARERARDHAFDAAARVHQVSDPHWEVAALLRLSDILSRCEDHDDAAGLAERALTLLATLQSAVTAA
jgi:tetratricopeptide (TPR) repeat protein